MKKIKAIVLHAMSSMVILIVTHFMLLAILCFIIEMIGISLHPSEIFYPKTMISLSVVLFFFIMKKRIA